MEQYTVNGMSCAACQARVEKAVSKVPGVTSCSVSLLTNSMGVEGTADAAAVISAVEHAGYSAEKKELSAGKKTGIREKIAAEEDALKDRTTPVLRKRLISSVIFLVALMYFSMGVHMWGWPVPAFFAGDHVALGLIQLLLSGAIMVINQKFFKSGFISLFHGAPNMDTLIALGAGAAFGYSTVMLFAMSRAQLLGGAESAMVYMNELYFESAGMILTLITVGKMLEAYSKGKTTNALKSLLKLAPKTATLLREGKETEVSVDDVVPGDLFVVRPGEQIPVDGVIVEGNSAVNESALTGESIPVDKEEGSQVSSGTLNQSGFLTCRATRVGEDTALAQIISMVSDAAATKAPVARLADRISGIFVPAVILIAAAVIAVWLLLGEPVGFALARGISVLVVSCPCALGLATPVAIMVANGMGAKHGILFKTAEAMQETGAMQIIALDKTGTITEGRPAVTDLIPADGISAEELLQKAAALEKKSEHPLAKAVMDRAEEERVDIPETEDFRILAGSGVEAVLLAKGQEKDAEKIKLSGGSRTFIGERFSISASMHAQADRLASQGKTPLFFAENDRVIGMIAVADEIRPDSAQAIAELKHMGIRVVMLTGDNRQTAMAIGAQAGVDYVAAGVMPDGKEAIIRKLQARGKTAMVGDGINDAPALTRADIGMAIGAGTDVAVDAADVVLMKSRLTDVAAAVRLSRHAYRNIKENLFWALIYNVLLIPMAAGLWIHFGLTMNPMWGAAAMSLSSIFVVSNALRLNLLRMTDSSRDSVRRAVNLADLFDESGAGQVEKERSGREQTNKGGRKMKTIKIEGMMCGHCEATVKKALEAVDGVTEARVSHVKGTAEVELSKDVPDAVLKEAVEAKDYTVISID